MGSAIIKAAPGEYLTVARVLNDRESTVAKHYAKFSSGDANARMAQILGSSLSKL